MPYHRRRLDMADEGLSDVLDHLIATDAPSAIVANADFARLVIREWNLFESMAMTYKNAGPVVADAKWKLVLDIHRSSAALKRAGAEAVRLRARAARR